MTSSVGFYLLVIGGSLLLIGLPTLLILNSRLKKKLEQIVVSDSPVSTPPINSKPPFFALLLCLVSSAIFAVGGIWCLLYLTKIVDEDSDTGLTMLGIGTGILALGIVLAIYVLRKGGFAARGNRKMGVAIAGAILSLATGVFLLIAGGITSLVT